MPGFKKCPELCRLKLPLCVMAMFSIAPTAFADSHVVARLQDRMVTLEEIDAAGGREIYDAAQQLYEARVRNLYRLLSEELLQREAKATKTSVEELLKKAVTATRDTVSESDIDALLKSRTSNIQNDTAQDTNTRKQAAMYLVARRRADEKRAYVTTLFEKYGVRVSLDAPPPPPSEQILGASEPAIGKPNAPVTIVAFSDYRCPYCQKSSETLNRLLEQHPNDVRVIYRHFPLHPDSKELAEGALCAGDQGHFLDYHNLLFSSTAVKPSDLEGLAKQLGLDADTFSSCLKADSHVARIDEDLKEGQRLGLQGTPTLFVNGLRLRGAQSYERLSARVQEALRKNSPVSVSHAR